MSGDEERFWRSVDKSGECWIWTAGRTQSGYGRFALNHKTHRAHRISWEFTNGNIPEGLWVLHHCDNRACVRPDHLYLGTHSDNVKDRSDRERQARGEKVAVGKLTSAHVIEIRQLRESGLTYRQIAKRFDVSDYAIYAIVRGKTWRHIKEAA